MCARVESPAWSHITCSNHVAAGVLIRLMCGMSRCWRRASSSSAPTLRAHLPFCSLGSWNDCGRDCHCKASASSGILGHQCCAGRKLMEQSLICMLSQSVNCIVGLGMMVAAVAV